MGGINTDQEPAQNWSPPQNFIRVGSNVPGVSVYAPKPEKKVADHAISFACPNCGANTAYNVGAGGIACEYCGYIAPIETQRIGKKADRFEFTLETIAQSAKGWGTQRQVMHCDSCGVDLSIAAGTVATTCPYCASNQVNVITSPAETLRPRYLVPFQVPPQQTNQLAQAWLGKGWFHPNDLAATMIIQKLMGIYLPYWTFTAQILGQWRAEVGYERRVRHYNASSKTWETRSVIDWRWEKGEVGLNIEDFMVIGSSPQRLSHKILMQLYPFNLQNLVAYQPDFLAGWQAQAYEITLTQAWEQCKMAMREQAKNACRKDIHSPHVRNFGMIADFSDETWRYILLPVYLASYKHNQKTYQMMINGQTGAVAGQKPVAWWKIWLVVAALLAPGLVMLLMNYIAASFSREGGGSGCIGLILLITGLGISIPLLIKARKAEEK